MLNVVVETKIGIKTPTVMDSIKYKLFLFVTVNVICIHHVMCYPYGPPHSVCDNGLPIHAGKDGVVHPPQTSPCPFQITVNATSYRPGDVISVKVSGNQREMFKGIFLQMRAIPSFDGDQVKNLPVGSFTREVDNTKAIACDVVLDSVSHKDPHMKFNTRLNWKSPLLMKHDVVARATILTNFSTYWTDVESTPIKLIQQGKLPAEGLERPWLEEIVKSEKAKDKLTSRDLVRSRFTRGYKGAIDPHGYIMVHYVLDILPFHNSQFGVNNTSAADPLTNSTLTASPSGMNSSSTNGSQPSRFNITNGIKDSDLLNADVIRNTTNNINTTPGIRPEIPVSTNNVSVVTGNNSSPGVSQAHDKEIAYQQLLRQVLDGDMNAINKLERQWKESN